MLCLLLPCAALAEGIASQDDAKRALGSDAVAARLQAIQWLGKQGVTSVPPLAAHVAEEYDVDLLRVLIGVLANLADTRAIPALRTLVRHEDLSIRTTALAVVARLDRRAGRDLAMQVLRRPRDNDPSWKERSAALLVLAELGDREAFFLVAEAYREGGGPKRWLARACFARLIGALKPSDAAQRLRPMLGDEDARVSVTAAKALFDLGASGQAVLTELLSHEASRVRIAAIAGFHRDLPAAVRARFRQSIRLDASPAVRWAATQALWRVADPAADEVVLEATRSQEQALRVTAFHLLERRLGVDHGTDLAAWRKALAAWRTARK